MALRALPTNNLLRYISIKLSNTSYSKSAECIRSPSLCCFNNSIFKYIQTSCLIYIHHHQLLSICSHHMPHPLSSLPKGWRYNFFNTRNIYFWNIPGACLILMESGIGSSHTPCKSFTTLPQQMLFLSHRSLYTSIIWVTEAVKLFCERQEERNGFCFMLLFLKAI